MRSQPASTRLPFKQIKPGVYRGEFAEFCGLQHAHMGFMLVAQGDADYHSWLSTQQQAAATPADQTAEQG